MTRSSIVMFLDSEIDEARKISSRITELHQISGRFQNIFDARGKSAIDFDAVISEWAVHKYLGIRFDKIADGESDNGFDFYYNGFSGQVKHTKHKAGRLIFYKEKTSGVFVSDIAVLATDSFSRNGIVLRGWITRKQFDKVQRPFHVKTGQIGMSVSQDQLMPMGDLVNLNQLVFSPRGDYAE